ncbi:hypothetical protein R3P38DRAFT_2906903 [Favolaschia claudopus]|uniref:Secreted protein n=1 Tax=Favolaschia claudopus TaxID=2862362 RepID=A0AAW0CDV3_9AGAR
MCLWTSYLRLHALSRYIRSGFMLAVISRLVQAYMCLWTPYLPRLHAFMVGLWTSFLSSSIRKCDLRLSNTPVCI